MQESNIIRIEDQIQFSFENFSSFPPEQQAKLIEIVTTKFKIEQMQWVVREPVFYGIVQYCLPVEQYPMRTRVTSLLSDELFCRHLKENINEPKIELLQNFTSLMKFYTGAAEMKWQKHFAILHPKLGTTLINIHLTDVKKELENRYCSEYRLNGIVEQIIDLYKVTGLKLGDLVLMLKTRPKQLELISSRIPEAAKYVNMI